MNKGDGAYDILQTRYRVTAVSYVPADETGNFNTFNTLTD